MPNTYKNRCSATTEKGTRCKRNRWLFGDSTLCKQHAKMAFKQSDKFSIINYRYTHLSKHAVDGLGSSADQAIEL
eukprot:SAG22_NODE_682_length_7924_cov_25.432460_10_plen_75_part_00